MKNDMNSIDIDKVMEQFDFAKVQKHMKANGLTYWDSPETPSLDNLRATAYQCLSTVVRENSINCSTGGFLALNLTYPSGTKDLQLIFQLENSYMTKPLEYS